MEGDLGIPLSARTSGVTVAVKRSVWREVGGGRMERQVSTSGSWLPFPVARRRSASSRTTKRTRRKPQIVSSPETLMWLANRPGVAITTCGLWERARACSRMSVPPVMRTGFKDCGAEMALNCSNIWSASSLCLFVNLHYSSHENNEEIIYRVGVNTTANIPVGSSAHF